ncbi:MULTISPECIES: YbaN family protein [unclassified Streptococcus]|uniref:YbaN family protein n=1 Tax=unclassified Streptococcus TaxID=2608887 RepID=UPI0018CB7583|nr:MULTISPECIES: YbaN family protein [unclassified Streptococcus]MBG9366899.1 YbaN family protein [Streptococcus sp. NLN64]MBJ6745051.1 YbaN family protein [Streptococcus sp. 121]
MKRIFYLILGSLSLLIGTLGIFLPILPTTPFLLLASFCFAKSSQRLNEKLKRSKIYRYYALDYATSRSIPRRRKKAIIIQIYLLMGLSLYFAPIIWVKGALGCLTVFITYYLFWVIPDKE